MKGTIAITIPVYKQTPDIEEIKNLNQANCILSHRDVFLIHPEGLNTSEYCKIFPNIKTKPFHPQYFENIKGYNKLMMEKDFYQAFQSYKYVLILQPDVLIFKDDLDYWIAKDYDYVGAPWHNHILHFAQYCLAKSRLKHIGRLMTSKNIKHTVGNGGFSLRKTQTFIEVCQHDPKLPSWKGNEDYFWSLIARKSDGKPLYKPNDKEAAKFCIETSPEYYRNFLTTEPMALHAYTKHGKEFWEKVIEEKIPGYFNEN